MDPHELDPLEAGTPPRPRPRRSPAAPRACLRGPLRLCRLLALMILLPSLFIFVPLYLRYRVFSGQMYPMSMTDMRLIDSKISPTWCQRQVVRSNATFNAFVVPSAPALTEELVPVSMTRELELEDDMKEYWGFYLLRGSTVTVSTCVRWPGASLIMIKGYKHLQGCAYIGDDSSEELDELLDAHALGLLSDDLLQVKMSELRVRKVDGKANDPETMKRHKAGVRFHDPSVRGNATSPDPVPTMDVTDHDPKELREILESLHAARQAQKTEALKHYRPPAHLMSLPALHRHRDANVDRDERRWLSFKDIDGNSSQSILKLKINTQTVQSEKTKDAEISNINTELKTKTLIEKEHPKIETENKTEEHFKDVKQETQETVKKVTDIQQNFIEEDKKYLDKEKEESLKTMIAETSYRPNDIKQPTENIAEVAEQNSKEVFEDVLHQLQALGDKGKRVLMRLHETMGVKYQEKQSQERLVSTLTGSEEELDRLRRVLVEAIDEEKTRAQRQQKRRDARSDARAKRELMLGQAELSRQLNDDDEPRNLAQEEDLDPDGFADHHEHLNETTAFDMSNSEFWSSFSSSEEALLECEGLILNLPLTPHPQCVPGVSEADSATAARANALTYRVPANGYYFFVFNSENEVQTNYIRARFDLQKTRYDIARTKLRECTNSTDRCDLSLDIFSSQKVVLEVPLRDNDSLWNEQFVIISECEPRTSVYLACAIAVPILILVFAFQ